MLTKPIASVIIPAHNEEFVIGRCLDALMAGARAGEFEIVVVANGCTDRTIAAAERPGVQILDVPAIGKAAALNLGDATVTTFPRIFLDADVEISASTARELAGVLAALPGESGESEAMVAGARPRVATSECSKLVRWYYDVWSALPVLADGYVGSGVFALAETAHARVVPFPGLVADDLYVRRSFERSERCTVTGEVVIHPPSKLVGLVNRAIRVRAGNVQLESSKRLLAEETAYRGCAGLLRSREVGLRKVLAFAAVSVVVRVAAEIKRRCGRESVWNRDESSRRRAGKGFGYEGKALGKERKASS